MHSFKLSFEINAQLALSIRAEQNKLKNFFFFVLKLESKIRHVTLAFFQA